MMTIEMVNLEEEEEINHRVNDNNFNNYNLLSNNYFHDREHFVNK